MYGKNQTFQNLSEVNLFFIFHSTQEKVHSKLFLYNEHTHTHVFIRAAYLSCFIVFHRFILLRVFVLNPFFYPPPPSVDFA